MQRRSVPRKLEGSIRSKSSLQFQVPWDISSFFCPIVFRDRLLFPHFGRIWRKIPFSKVASIRRLHQRLTLAIRLRRPNQLAGRVVAVRPRQPRIGSPRHPRLADRIAGEKTLSEANFDQSPPTGR